MLHWIHFCVRVQAIVRHSLLSFYRTTQHKSLKPHQEEAPNVYLDEIEVRYPEKLDREKIIKLFKNIEINSETIKNYIG